MDYAFEIIGVSPVLSFFNHQLHVEKKLGAEYLGTYHCTLDAFIESIETKPLRQEWRLDRVVDSVIRFWFNNAEQVQYWKKQLSNAGRENLIVARVADLDALRAEFEFLLEN